MLNRLIASNPNIANNPRNKALLDVVMSGDAQKGKEIAMNLCQTYGASKEEAVNMASSWAKNAMMGQR